MLACGPGDRCHHINDEPALVLEKEWKNGGVSGMEESTECRRDRTCLLRQFIAIKIIRQHQCIYRIFYSTSHATSTMTDDLTNLHPHSISKAFREIMATLKLFWETERCISRELQCSCVTEHCASPYTFIHFACKSAGSSCVWVIQWRSMKFRNCAYFTLIVPD